MWCPALTDFPSPPSDGAGWPWVTDRSPAPGGPVATEWPRISIVTPSYNQGRFIEETIRSVLLQGYPNLEYVVIDAGSTDGTVEILRRYEPWIAYWVSEADGGQSYAINKGWRRCTGEILAWLNADDLYEPDALRKVAEAYRANPGVGLIHGLCLEFNDGGVQRIMGGLYDAATAVSVSFDAGGRVAQPSAFVTRKAMQRVGMLDGRLRQAMDKDLWQRVGLLYPVYHIPCALARFRAHPDQLSAVHARDRCFPICRERLIGVENLFALDGLPADFLRLKSRILARAHLRLAREYRFNGEFRAAMKHLACAMRDLHWTGNRADLREFGIALSGRTAARAYSALRLLFR